VPAEADADVGDRNYLVVAKPNVIMNDIRLRGLAVAGTDAAGRKSPHNHAQTARNLKRSLRNAAAGARLIQADGLDSKSAAEVAASLADALEELHRLKRRSFVGLQLDGCRGVEELPFRAGWPSLAAEVAAAQFLAGDPGVFASQPSSDLPQRVVAEVTRDLASRTRTVWQCQSVSTSSGRLPTLLGVPWIRLPQLHRPAARGQRRRFLTPLDHGASSRASAAV
jgi:hypothetical protein